MVFDGIDLAGLSERGMRDLRGARISMVMQDPKFSLNPVMTVGDQIAEALRDPRDAAAPRRAARASSRCWSRCRSTIPSAWPGSIRTRSPAAWASG